VPYSLPKCDVVSSPAMIGGAMENWGLLIHKSNLLLVDEEKSTMLSKEKFQIF
jgi:aminopeptidase N